MGLLDKLFKSQRDIAKDEIQEGLPWQMLESEDQLNNLIANSKRIPKVIFKHSTRCGISRMVLKNFEAGYSLKEEEASFYLLDLLNNRELSNTIASKLNVMHQSPQIIIIDNEEIIHTDSHHGIDIKRVEQLIKKDN
ncbi:bacillithiol system redox-active protein YtxJ [Nonlabens ulvanivorans]|uniref:bacillithiol system redox-active protein YtxJ n=1 Tax=Nonlabens ulvanivorans TaxID=906888 RepID=UPI0005A7D358|nr:bacillithiol system redox-active protein YtxJ [Nonlabens ulvanivorans]WOI23671.1 bacillithiol system redox-active protein YtxJ [Nonlabens ulvanivorans]